MDIADLTPYLGLITAGVAIFAATKGLKEYYLQGIQKRTRLI